MNPGGTTAEFKEYFDQLPADLLKVSKLGLLNSSCLIYAFQRYEDAAEAKRRQGFQK